MTQKYRTKALMNSEAWLALIFLILTNHSSFVTPQNYNCYNDNGNSYISNNIYNTNLHTLLSSLSSKIDSTGFHNASEGQAPDRANAIALCRGDAQLHSCRTCVQNATVDIVRLCPNQKRAIVWRDLCTLRYSNESIFGIRADAPVSRLYNGYNVSSPVEFNEELTNLVDDLAGQAASGGSLVKVAAGSRKGPSPDTIYALLQCTPDLSAEDCRGCLMGAAQDIRMCCSNQKGMRFFGPSCYFQYEVMMFYNVTRIQEVQAMLFVPAPVPAPVSRKGNGDHNKGRTLVIIIVVVVVSVVVCLLLATCLVICLRRRAKKKLKETIGNGGDEISTPESLQYDFSEIKAATDDFSEANKLGQGGFGVVYKGKLRNGQEVAVKRLSRSSGQGDLEFKNEVFLLAKLQHRNLVRLLGFTLHGTERLLVYEFAQNASLDGIIFDPIKRFHTDWNRRYKIIEGIARGLLYLHEDSRFRVIHRDLKASNILLDGEMNPKIADFGMARLFARDECEGSTSRIVGTYGYMPPEYAMNGKFSVKLDVFSFGVLVLEIVSGHKNKSYSNREEDENMLSFAWRNWHEGASTNVIDPALRSGSCSLDEMLRCVHIGLLCVQQNAVDRPTMASVLLMLNGVSTSLAAPSQPAFFVSSSSDTQASALHNLGSSQDSESRSHQSKNDASITDLYPR